MENVKEPPNCSERRYTSEELRLINRAKRRKFKNCRKDVDYQLIDARDGRVVPSKHAAKQGARSFKRFEVLRLKRLGLKPTCAYCGRILRYKGGQQQGKGKNGRRKNHQLDATTDHVIPRSRGGTNDWANFVLSCERCNLVKGQTIMIPLKPNWLFLNFMLGGYCGFRKND